MAINGCIFDWMQIIWFQRIGSGYIWLQNYIQIKINSYSRPSRT